MTSVKTLSFSKENRVIVTITGMLVVCALACTAYAVITKDATPLIFISILCSGVFVYAVLDLNKMIVNVEKEFREYVDAVDTIFKAISLLEEGHLTQDTLTLIKKAIESANKEKADVEALFKAADTLQTEVWTAETIGVPTRDMVNIPEEESPSQTNIIPTEKEDLSLRV